MYKIKSTKAITLIALVITVIIMLILAGVSFSVLTGAGGLFDKTKGAIETYNESVKNENDKFESLLNKLDDYIIETPTANDNIQIIVSPAVATNSSLEIELRNLTGQERFILEYQVTRGEWVEYIDKFNLENNANLNVRLKNKYTDEIGSNLEYHIGNIDKVKPNDFELSTISTTNSITINGNTTDAASPGTSNDCIGIAEYQYKLNDGNWISLEDKLSTSYTFENLTQGTDYIVSMRAIDKAGNITEVTNKDLSVATGTVPTAEGNLVFIPSNTNYTNQEITVKMSTSTGLTIQYQINGTDENSWLYYTSGETGITIGSNCIIYGRLLDNTGQAGNTTSITISNVDKLIPSSATISAPSDNITTTSFVLNASGADATATTTDAKSEISRYEFYVGESLFQTVSTSSTSTSVTVNFGSASSLNCYVIVYDAAENSKPSSTITVNKHVHTDACYQKITPQYRYYVGEVREDDEFSGYYWCTIYCQKCGSLHNSADNLYGIQIYGIYSPTVGATGNVHCTGPTTNGPLICGK